MTVTIDWASPTEPLAVEPLAGSASPAHYLLAETLDGLYTPYALGSLALAAVVTWACPQTWDWTRRLTPLRAVLSLAALALALVAMASQGYNPFIYFIF